MLWWLLFSSGICSVWYIQGRVVTLVASSNVHSHNPMQPLKFYDAFSKHWCISGAGFLRNLKSLQNVIITLLTCFHASRLLLNLPYCRNQVAIISYSLVSSKISSPGIEFLFAIVCPMLLRMCELSLRYFRNRTAWCFKPSPDTCNPLLFCCWRFVVCFGLISNRFNFQLCQVHWRISWGCQMMVRETKRPR